MSKMEPVLNFIEEAYGPEDLCKITDGIIFGYLFALLDCKEKEIDKTEVEKHISALYQLRNALWECKES